MKTIKALAKEICRREGKKKQVDIAQVSEILGHLSDMAYEWSRDFETNDEAPNNILWANGEKRAKKKNKVQRSKK